MTGRASRLYDGGMLEARSWSRRGALWVAAMLVASGAATTSAGGTGGTGSSGAGGAAGGGACSELGMACTGTCGAGFHCTQSVCTPDGRAQCGGFAGTACPGEFAACLMCEGCDYGVCFTEAERACVCATASGKATFPSCMP